MEERFLRTGIAKGLSKNGRVDREENIIYGYSVMEKGFVKDFRGWEIDDDTLDQVVKSGNAIKAGAKSRFGHPNMSGTAFGTFLGRAKNFRKDGDVVRADLHLSETSFSTPNGDLGTYVLNMAENEPEMFGTSLVLRDFSFEYRLEKDGTRKKDKQGNDCPPLLRVKSLAASDVVDSPAATNGMFATQFFNNSVKPSAEMTEFLDKFLASDDAVDKVLSFLTRYKTNRDEIDEDLEVTQEKKIKQGVDDMDLKTITLEQLQAGNPDLFKQIQDAAKSSENKDKLQAISAAKAEGKAEGVNEATSKERARVLGILAFTKVKELSAYGAVAEKCITDGDTVAKAELAIKDARLADLEKGANKPIASGDGNALEGGVGTGKAKTSHEEHLDRGRAYQAEHKCSLEAAMKATADKK